MARSLIRLPQLNAASLANSGQFEFQSEDGTKSLLSLDTQNSKLIAKQKLEMDNKEIDFDNGSGTSVANISATGSIRVGQSGSEMFQVDSATGDVTAQGDLVLMDGANVKMTLTASSGAVTLDGDIRGKAGLQIGAAATDFEYDESGGTNGSGLFRINDGAADVFSVMRDDGALYAKGDFDLVDSNFVSDAANTKVTSLYAVMLNNGSADQIVLKPSGDATFGGNVLVKGDLTVDGTRTFLNTQESSLADTTIALGMPGGMMDVSYTVTSIDDDGSGGGTGNGYDEITVTFDSNDVVTSGGWSGGEEIYLVSSDLADGFKEGVFTIGVPSNVSGTTYTTVVQIEPSYTATNGTSVAAFMSRDEFTQSKPYDGSGLIIPGQERIVSLLWDGNSNAMELVQANLRVIKNYIGIERDSSNAAAHKIEFSSGANAISLTAAAPTGTRDISVPDASGVMAVSVAKSGAQAQGSEDYGLQLDSSGALSIDINGIGGALTGANALATGDEIMISDASSSNEIKKTTLGDIQAFLSSGGTQKQYIVAVADSNGYVDYSSLSAGFITDLEASVEASREIYLNGVLMREGSGNDVEVDGANDRLDFTFAIEANDVVLIALRA
jgi:hypothetical protein